MPDTHPSYEDRAYGGAGLDILIGNTGGDRLIDWVGEFNSYLVPFAPFGIATVSRQNDPALPEFLYALSHSQGADPTRATDTGDDAGPQRRADGELGLVTPEGPRPLAAADRRPDRPAGRATSRAAGATSLRGADFNDGTLQGFAVDSGVLDGRGRPAAGRRRIARARTRRRSSTSTQYLPIYYEIHGADLDAEADRRLERERLHHLRLLVADRLQVRRHRRLDQQDGDRPPRRHAAGSRRAGAGQRLASSRTRSTTSLVDVNGLVVTVSVNGSQCVQLHVRAADASPTARPVGLNKGLVGFGSNNSRRASSTTSPSRSVRSTNTLDTTKYFEDGQPEQFTGPSSGTWAQSNGRDVGTAAGERVRRDHASTSARRSTRPSTVEVDATLNTTGIGGIAFDVYAANDFKFAALDVAGQRVDRRPRRSEARLGRATTSFAAALVAGTDYVLDVVLKDTVATVSLNGNVLGSYAFNAGTSPTARSASSPSAATTSVDRFELRTDDAAFSALRRSRAELRIGDATVTEGNSGQDPVNADALAELRRRRTATTVGWPTVDGTATAAARRLRRRHGTVTFAAGATSAADHRLASSATRSYEPNETFTVQLTSAPGLNLADGFGMVTITNDDPLRDSLGRQRDRHRGQHRARRP